VQAARLTGRQPVVVTVRNTAAARAITNEWRMRDLRTGAIYDVEVDAVVRTDDRRFLEILVTGGVAT
jgi:head-tail adaptor